MIERYCDVRVLSSLSGHCKIRDSARFARATRTESGADVNSLSLLKSGHSLDSNTFHRLLKKSPERNVTRLNWTEVGTVELD